MRAYNARRTSKEIYLFRKKGKEISLTKMIVFTSFLDGTVTKKNTHRIFKVIRRNKIEFLRNRHFEQIAFEKQLQKILFHKREEMSISSMIAFFKGMVDNGKYTVDFTKVQRKDFVSRNILEIIDLLKEKGVLKENKEVEQS